MQVVPRGLRPLLARSPRACHPSTRIRCAVHTSTTATSTTNDPSSSSRPHNPTSPSTNPTNSTHFGFRSVPEESKEALVRGVFDSVASSYDLMNDAMSLGVHRLWKDSFVSLLRPGSSGPIRARETHGDRETRVDVVDINGEMLKEGYTRFKKTMYHNTPQVAFIEGNAQALPLDTFPDNTYDLYTIAFGIRNVTSIPDVLREAHRVLKPGGIFACLEFNKVTNPLLAQFYDQYSFSVIPLLGTILAGDRASYQYLVESIRRFPSQGDFARMIAEAGLAIGGDFEGDDGAWRDLWGGIACIHTGVKK
ncbi:ubiE/COQ5 methyltransferase family-domain-containing protein [Russula ochroleuca]|uniref:2-methoxy-6-polyprenyl-1,4-benzoquinol methylase, mitochondrial n=1 Tax=Russula ochroleuca TaxID=152965 RepID=A0A9P5JXZ8_9AGAM|nr:ubiE/COQ5 methyltransferase family-domain-containing protein [Russula ochroleuca]